MSVKRSSQLREYFAERERYLADHPICMVWLAENGFSNYTAVLDASSAMTFHTMGAPASTEIHHKNRRNDHRLTDERFWMAVSRENHVWIHNHPKEARERGFLI